MTKKKRSVEMLLCNYVDDAEREENNMTITTTMVTMITSFSLPVVCLSRCFPRTFSSNPDEVQYH